MVDCANCGKPLNAKQTRFCGRVCQAIGQLNPERPCANDACGKIFRPLKGRAKYCCRQCAAIHSAYRHSDKIREGMIRLHATGMKFSAIAAELGITHNAVCGLRRRLNLQPIKRQPKLVTANAWSKRRPEDLPPSVRIAVRERIMAGAEPLPPMHPISWGAIAL